MVKVAICGCNGKMGRVVTDIIEARDDCEVIAGIDLAVTGDRPFPVVTKPADLKQKPDVIIDYSHPSSLEGLLSYGLLSGTAIVVVSTGYSAEQIASIKKAAEQIPIFFSFNMSLGANLLVELAKKATAVLAGSGFDIEIIERHHNQKVDAPSGTAIMLADAINETLDNPRKYVYDRHSQRGKRDKNEIGIHSIRGGTIVGEHEVIFAGRDEVITLSHHAASKEIFAVGSVNAALFLAKAPSGLYNMSSLI